MNRMNQERTTKVINELDGANVYAILGAVDI